MARDQAPVRVTVTFRMRDGSEHIYCDADGNQPPLPPEVEDALGRHITRALLIMEARKCPERRGELAETAALLGIRLPPELR